MTQCIQNYIQCGTKEIHDGFLDLFLPVIKLDLKKHSWVVLLFKNFHSVLCECFNYGFYQHPGALF